MHHRSEILETRSRTARWQSLEIIIHTYLTSTTGIFGSRFITPFPPAYVSLPSPAIALAGRERAEASPLLPPPPVYVRVSPVPITHQRCSFPPIFQLNSFEALNPSKALQQGDTAHPRPPHTVATAWPRLTAQKCRRRAQWRTLSPRLSTSRQFERAPRAPP